MNLADKYDSIGRSKKRIRSKINEYKKSNDSKKIKGIIANLL